MRIPKLDTFVFNSVASSLRLPFCRGTWRVCPVIFLLGPCLLSLLSGCSGPAIERVPVSGQVLLDGEPLERGIISVVPTGARIASARLDAEGRFSLMTYEPGDGVPLGEHRVSVNAGEQLGPNAIRWHAPKKYASHKASGLTMEIEGPNDAVVVNLTWDGKGPFVQKFAGGSVE